jgi:hypothetical protein
VSVPRPLFVDTNEVVAVFDENDDLPKIME